MIKYGIKLWTTNKGKIFEEAAELIKKKEIDFLELYIVPDSLDWEKLELMKEVPVIIHCTHSAHNFNLFNLNNREIKIFKEQVVKAVDFFNSKFIIVHAGIGNSLERFKENVSKIYDKRIIIENLPKAIPLDIPDKGPCFGHSLEQLKFIRELGFDICLDLAHALKSAKSQGLDYKDFIESLILELKPSYLHIAGGNKDIEKDEHMNLFEGDFDIKWIKRILSGLSEERDIYLVFEVPKNKDDLKNDIKNINYFKKC